MQDVLRSRCADVRWTPPDDMHVTVKFLGEVEDGRINGVMAALELAAGQCSGFDLRVAGAGCFPPRGAVRIVWAGVEDPAGAAARCADAVESALEAVGFAREARRFSPHITVGRVGQDRSLGRLRRAVESVTVSPEALEVEALHLMASVRSPRGARYETVATWRLTGPPGQNTELG